MVVGNERECSEAVLKLLHKQMVKYPMGKILDWFPLLLFLEDHIVNIWHILSIFLADCPSLR